MSPDLLKLLREVQEVKLVIDGVSLLLTVRVPQTDAAPLCNTGGEPSLFRFHNTTWCIEFRGRTVTRRHSLGLAYIHALLARPHEIIAARELYIQATGENPSSKSERELLDEGLGELGLSVSSDYGEVVIPNKARQRMLRSLGEMKEDIARLRDAGDDDLAFEKQQEIETLEELLRKINFKGHHQRFPSEAEKVRKRVSNAIARAIADLEQEHPALSRHLDNSIHTGKQCSYRPEADVKWLL